MIFKLESHYVQKGEKIDISKSSWTLRGGFHWGGVLFMSKEKHLKQGEKISNLENASQSLIHLPLTICKRTLKRFYKRFCKNKTCGASVVQNVKNEENNPCISYKYLYWLHSKQPLHLQLCKLVQLCISIFALVCVGINHQKGGDWKGIRLTPSS